MELEQTRIYLQNLFNRPFVSNIIDLYNIELKIAILFPEIDKQEYDKKLDYANEWAEIYNMHLIIPKDFDDLKKSLEYFKKIIIKNKDEKIKILINGIANANILKDFDIKFYYDNWFIQRVSKKTECSVFDRIKTLSAILDSKEKNILTNLEQFLFTNTNDMTKIMSEEEPNYLYKAFAEFYYLADEYEIYSPIHVEFYTLQELALSCWLNENEHFVVQDVRLPNRVFMIFNLQDLSIMLEVYGIIKYRIVETGYIGRDLNMCLSWILENIHRPKELFSPIPEQI